ncbi:MAG: tRNA 2-thiouridine(34) synthase MnmA [Bacillota bacterium]|nr:tRNA 2-thiouridine(34) synthase MnmA [Bacillota bacterium]
MNNKVMVAMSGGVDSSVAAALLIEQGYEIIGATLKLFGNEDIGLEKETRTCCALNDVEDARNVSYRLGFPHYVFNFGDRFKEQVIDRFTESYLCGETPNPCIDCNRFIKFNELLRRAVTVGCDYIATGHYAVSDYDEGTGRYLLKKSADRTKDQTYVLYSLTQEQLKRTLFPLGRLDKAAVRKIAEEKGLKNADKPDSQDICFVKNGDYASFIEGYTGKSALPGDFVDKNGNILGRHRGIISYTIGQRKGLGLSFGKPMYVTAKDTEKNTVTVGPEGELYSKSLTADDVNLISVEELKGPMRITAKTRYSQKEQPGTIYPSRDGGIYLEFDSPQRAVTPGQAVVFYDGETVVGGGTIRQSEEEK